MLDRIVQFTVSDWFQDIIFDINPVFLCFCRSKLFCSEHEHRNILCPGIFLNSFKSFPSVDRFHHNIQKNKIGCHCLQDLQTFLPAIGSNSPVTSPFQHGNKYINNKWTVIDNKNGIHHIDSPIVFATASIWF